MAADVCFNYQLQLKSHVALAVFIYLYLNEDTESLIKVIIVASSVRRGSCMSDRAVCRHHTASVACGPRCAQADPRSVRH